MRKTIKYTLKGYVFGSLWGGGKGFYPAVPLYGTNLKKILTDAEKNLNQLDSGMGFQEVLGAIYFPTKIETIYINGKEYSNKEYLDNEVIGDIDERNLDYFYDNLDGFMSELR
jgi:hypothetical protein